MPIARIQPDEQTASGYQDFLVALAQAGFEGEIDSGAALRTVLATDNSIYQRRPQAAVFPRHANDVQCVLSLLAEPRFSGVVLAPRGGGTGTNGQSLTDGIVLDLSRHMNRILEIDAQAGWARVEAGVVKDQLNAALAPHGLFFAPELSTSNRATIGGMVNTDASGQGSCIYGKTRDHVLSLDFVLLGGELLHSTTLDDEQLAERCAQGGRIGHVYRTARHIRDTQAERIEATFPKLNRCLTGYDLAHLREADGRFNLNSVLCGSEGSLGVVVEAKLNLLKIPSYTVLVNVRYASFMDALRDARALMALRPLSIETVDSKVLGMAMKDIVWSDVAEYFPADPDHPTLGINLVEFSGNTEREVNARVAEFVAHIEADTSVQRLGQTLAEGGQAVERVYAMRKRSVGLLGNVQGEARPQPFVEDTAVPPEHLADYIAEFRALLDSHGLDYGMFGHVDAGVLHVRPLLDMKNPRHAALIRPVTDAVAALTQRYGGLLWGEHGKGMRSEYVPAFFGDLYPALQQLKAAFDPDNQLNPGKIATPAGRQAILLKVDGVPTRGEHDRQIDERVWSSHGTAMHCNGNGACYNFDPDDAMCPSWKVTRRREHSPKGRVSLLREWLRLQQAAGVDVLHEAARPARPLRSLWQRWRNSQAARNGAADFSHQVYDAMAGCLGCKACAGQCPVKVNVPEARSRFLHLYHQRYLRPLRDYVIGYIEYTMPVAARLPRMYNRLMGVPWVQRTMERHLGMVDSPSLSELDLGAVARRWGVGLATPEALSGMGPDVRARTVVLVQDVFTRFFDTGLMADFLELASLLRWRVFLAPLNANGKPLHVQGFLPAFEAAARKNAQALNALERCGVALVGLEPATTLTYRQEYAKLLGDAAPKVLLPQEWLQVVLPERSVPARQSMRLFSHCTERTNAPDSTKAWAEVFRRLGVALQPVATGCCGMAGTFGHEALNRQNSLALFGASWAPALAAVPSGMQAVATGYSCRAQAARAAGIQLLHPVSALLDCVRELVQEPASSWLEAAPLPAGDREQL